MALRRRFHILMNIFCIGKWPLLLKLLVAVFIVIAFIKQYNPDLEFSLEAYEKDIKVHHFENSNLKTWLVSMPKKRLFDRLSLDIKNVVYRKLRNLTTNIDDVGAMNPHPFKFRYINNPGRCQYKNNNIRTVLIIVKSIVRNVLLRNAIRLTWGSITDDNVNLVFMLGCSNSSDVQRTIEEEAMTYKDIVQEDFIDAYLNNTLKTIMSFKWATEYCGNAQFLLFVDDDFVIDLPKILTFIYSIPEVDVETLFTGHRINQPVVRDKTSKWALSEEVFPYKYWPPYLSGGAYLTSMQVAKRFSLGFLYIPMLDIDDGWLGVVAANLGISPQDNYYFHYNGTYAHMALVYKCCHTHKEMFDSWRQYNKQKKLAISKLV